MSLGAPFVLVTPVSQVQCYRCCSKPVATDAFFRSLKIIRGLGNGGNNEKMVTMFMVTKTTLQHNITEENGPETGHLGLCPSLVSGYLHNYRMSPELKA